MRKFIGLAGLGLTVLISGCAEAPPGGGDEDKRGQAARSDGRTELMHAVEQGDVGRARALIESGANVNDATPDGVTALMTAAGRGHSDAMRLLIERGADVNARTPGRFTALMSAALTGQIEACRILLDAGADASVADVSGKTAAAWAEIHNHPELVALLKERSGGK